MRVERKTHKKHTLHVMLLINVIICMLFIIFLFEFYIILNLFVVSPSMFIMHSRLSNAAI